MRWVLFSWIQDSRLSTFILMSVNSSISKEQFYVVLQRNCVVDSRKRFHCLFLRPDSSSILLKWKCSIIRVLYLHLYPIKIFLFLLQFGEWVFTVTGKGTLPQPQEPVSLSAPAGANTTVIIPFRNPLDCAVSVDVLLTGRYSVLSLSVSSL